MNNFDTEPQKNTFIERGKRFLHASPRNLDNKYRIAEGVRNMRVSMSGSDDTMFQASLEAFIDRLKHIADDEGFVYAAQLSEARTGDLETDLTVKWNVQTLENYILENKIESVVLYRVSGSINLGMEDTVTNINDFNWEKVKQLFLDIFAESVTLKGYISNELSATVLRKNDERLTVQIFFSFEFSDFKMPSISKEIVDQSLEELILDINGYDSYDLSHENTMREYKVKIY